MNINEWNPYYKIDPTENRLVRSNMLYTPLVNPEGNVFCMNWDPVHPYQTMHGPRPDFTPELLEFFFEREVTHLKLFNNYTWSPEVIDIDEQNKMIFFKWYGETCNNIVYSDRTLDRECFNWQQQLYSIIDDIVNAGYYKMSLYPHCFYIDSDNQLHTFDFYGCMHQGNPFIEYDKIKGMVGPNSTGRFDEAITDNIVNVEILFKRSLENYIKWPQDALIKIYNRIYSS
jgi:hypothetical protein